jgi:hypothetical protein
MWFFFFLSAGVWSKRWQTSQHNISLLCLRNSQLKGLVAFLPGMVHVFCSWIKGLRSARAEILECEEHKLFQLSGHWFPQLSMILITFDPLCVPISEIDFVTVPTWQWLQTLSKYSSPLRCISNMFCKGYWSPVYKIYNLTDSVRAVLKVVILFIIH